jgi:hypothetical protein
METKNSIETRRPSDELFIDASVLNELEAHARSISSSLDMALRDLRGSLRGMSDLTNESMQVFSSIVCSTCDQVDSTIRSTYAMLAKAEEFNGSMQKVQKLLLEMWVSVPFILSIYSLYSFHLILRKKTKRMLDQFEIQFIPSTLLTTGQ